MTQTSSRLQTTQRMSNSGYHRAGQPAWWARIGDGADATFLRLPSRRGDRCLDVAVDVPVGTAVVCGAGRGSDAVRQTVTTAVPDPVTS